VLVGTEKGLFRVSDTGVEPVLGTSTTAIAADWVVVGDSEVVSLDTDVEVTTAPLLAKCVAASAHGALVGTDKAHVLRVHHDGRVETLTSFDAIPSRDHWYTPWGGPPDTRSIAVTDEGVPLVNVHVGGVWRASTADTWDEVVPVDSDTHQVLACESVVLVAAAVGFGESSDGGRTFSWTADGLHASYLRAVALAGDQVLLTASTGPFTDRAAVYRRGLGRDEPFERCTDWFGFNIDTFQLAADEQLAVFGTQAGELYASTDQGSSWTIVADDLPPVRCVAIP